MYKLAVEIWTVSEILGLLWSEWWGGGGYFRVTRGQCHWIHLIIKNKNIYDLGVGFWTVSEIASLIWSRRVGRTPRDPRSVSYDECYMDSYMKYVWFRDGDLNGFWDTGPLMKWRRGAYPGLPTFGVTYYKKQRYMRFRVDIWTVSVTQCVLL